MIGDDGFLRPKFCKSIGSVSLLIALTAGGGGGGGGGGGSASSSTGSTGTGTVATGSTETESIVTGTTATGTTATGTADAGSPVISVAPTSQVVAGTPFSLAPIVRNPKGVALSFTARNLPDWASIDESTGRISGTPHSGDVGTHGNIRIVASGGGKSVMSPAFAVRVSDVVSGAVTLTWLPPTQNADGSPLMDLAGYRIYYGRTPGQLNQSVTIKSPGITSYVIENLTPAVWYFVATAYNHNGIESTPSNSAAKRVM